MALQLPKKTIVAPDGAPAAEAYSGRKKFQQVAGPGFIKAEKEKRRRLVANLEAEEKCGKNHMAFTADGPIYLHSFDLGDEGVVEKFQDDKDIYVAEYSLEVQPGQGTVKEVSDCASKLWDQFEANFNDSIASTVNGGMVVVDTGTEVWELMRLASFGKLSQVMPHHYTQPNSEMNAIVRRSMDGTNVAWLHQCKDEWENYTDGAGREKGKKTGKKARVGFSKIPFLVQVNVRCWREDRPNGGSDFYATVLDCRQNPEVNGITIPNDWNLLMDMIFD